MSPIGVEGQPRTAARWRLYAAGAPGVVWFTRDRSALRIGYKFHHLSNAYTVPVNPKLDANVWVVGWQPRFGS